MIGEQFSRNSQAASEFSWDNPTGKVQIIITNRSIGSSKIRLIGHESFANKDTPSTLEVKLYQMIVKDPTTSLLSTYQVTRDSYVATKQDDDKYTSKETYVTNYAFEPASTISSYKGISMRPYPTGTNFGAIALRNIDGSDGLAVDSNRQNGKRAKDITIHVGGSYTRNNGEQRITGSLGCFTLSGKSGGNAGINLFHKDISNRHAENKYSGILITVHKRVDVDWDFIINKDGKKTWNW